MRLSNYINFSRLDPDKIPPARETEVKFAHANRDELVKFRKKTRLYAKKT